MKVSDLSGSSTLTSFLTSTESSEDILINEWYCCQRRWWEEEMEGFVFVQETTLVYQGGKHKVDTKVRRSILNTRHGDRCNAACHNVVSKPCTIGFHGSCFMVSEPDHSLVSACSDSLHG